MDSQPPTHSAQGARCSLHAGQPFVAICPSCGTYMCQLCTEHGTWVICPACRVRATNENEFALSRESLKFGEIWRFARKIYAKNWVTLGLAIMLCMVGMGVVQSLSTALYLMGGLGLDVMDGGFSPLSLVVSGLLGLLHSCLLLVFVAGFLRLLLRAVREQPVRLSVLFSDLRTLPKLALQFLVLNAALVPLLALIAAPLVFLGSPFGAASSDLLALLIFVFVPLMLGLVTYLSLGVCFFPLEVVAHPGLGLLEPIQNAWAVARGKRLVMLACGAVCFGLLFAGSLFCFVGLLAAIPFAGVLLTTTYLALRNGAQGLKA